jgi:5'-phosphate synthase pdxT subunit
MKIGILALQGGFQKHIDILENLGVETKKVRLKEDLREIEGLILPGGESTTNIKLIHAFSIFEEIKEFAKNKSVFGTCAGSILMGKKASDFEWETFGFIDVFVERNAYGTQVDSFETEFDFLNEKVTAMFIRAPKFQDIPENVEILAKHEENIVIVKQGRHLMSTCHPELSNEHKIHKYFLEMIQK